MIKLFKNKKDTTYAIIFGFIFSLINSMGKEFQDKVILSLEDYAIIFANTLLFTLVIAELYLQIQSLFLKYEEKRKKINKSEKIIVFSQNDFKYYMKCLFVLLIFYTSIFLAYYPGIFAYDVYLQIPQITSNSFSTHHPLIHTLYLKLFYNIIGGTIFHNYTIGVAIGTLVQMILFSVMISYIHLFLYRVNINKYARIFILLISSIVPVFSMMSISLTKDVFFCGFLGVLSVCICYWSIDSTIYKKRKFTILYILSIIGTVLFRNNGIYPTVAMFVVGVIIFIKNKNKTFILSTLTSIVISLLILFGLKTCLSAQSGSIVEMFNIPFQQIAYVYNTEYDNISNEDKAEIEKIMPRVKDYSPYLADYVKGSNNYSDKFWNIYFRLLTKYPIKYIEAFIQNNLGYLYIADTTVSHIYLMFGFMETWVMGGFDVYATPYFPHLKYICEFLFSYNNYLKLPVVSFFCSLSVYFWFIILMFFYCINLKRKTALLSGAFIFVFLMTVLAGPCALPRYALAYMVFIPALFVSVFSCKTHKNIEILNI